MQRTILLFAFFLTVVCDAASLEDYGRLPDADMVSISPDGKSIAFRQELPGGGVIQSNWLESGKYRASESLAYNMKVWSIDYVGNDDIIFVVSENTRISGFKGELDSGAAFLLQDEDSRQLIIPGQKLSRRTFVHPAQTGLGKIVGMNPVKRTVYVPAFLQHEGATPFGLLEISLDEEVPPKVVEYGRNDTKDYLVNRDGVALVQERYNEKSNQHLIQVKRNDDWETIYKNETEMMNFSIEGIAADYGSLVILAKPENSNHNALYSLSLQDGSLKPLDIGQSEKDIESVFSDTNRMVYGVSLDGFKPSYRMFDATLQKWLDELVRLFPDDSVRLVDWTPDWKTILILIEGSSYPGIYVAVSRGQQPVVAAIGREGIDVNEIHPIIVEEYLARDKFKIPTLLTVPRDKKGKIAKLPAVIFPHGGPAAHDTLGFDFFAQALANQGYLVVQPQFRGSTGFGTQHEEAGHGEWGGKMQDDVTDVVRHLIEKGYIDSRRICIAGASYGGYAALAGGAFTPDLYRCIVSIAGVSDVGALIKQEKEQRDYFSQQISYLKMSVGGGEFSAEKLRNISPINFAGNFRAPVLLIHGEKDKVVLYKQSQAMEAALKKAKKPVRLVKLEQEDHYLSYSDTRIETLKSMIGFINENIGEKAGQNNQPVAAGGN